MKYRLLDLFCGAGGAAKGYQRAGFYVVGVDNRAQPHYCGDEFHMGDAMTWPLEGFDAIHASPPCQDYSRALRHLAAKQPRLIGGIKERFVGNGVMWVIENVVGSPIPESDDLFGNHGVLLCGTMFGMRVYHHRLFESSLPLRAPSRCVHTLLAMNPHSSTGRQRIYDEFGRRDPEKLWREEKGVCWMNKHEGREAIPPAYTEYIGEQLMTVLDLTAEVRPMCSHR